MILEMEAGLYYKEYVTYQASQQQRRSPQSAPSSGVHSTSPQSSQLPRDVQTPSPSSLQ